MKRTLLSVVLCGSVWACGGGSDNNGTPTAPTPPAPAANQPPSITALSISSFGIQQLSQFNFSASATDPNGDALTYTWDIAGNAASGSSGTITFSVGGSGTARVTVTDGKGGTATDTRTFTVGSMTGTWRGSYPGFNFTSNLTQSGNRVSGDYADALGTGRLDPDFANTIDSDGNVVLRYKQGIFLDFTLRGRMDQSGRTISGGIFGSGYNGEAFTMTKQ
ncbi:MAG TPA: PKD domain-containing protein [Vicinamibacterales bacterium]|nr:PKD domain-containing protein [Vicinamibacterales bacterium]